MTDRLPEVEDELIQWRAKAGQDTLNFPVKLNAKLAALIGMLNGTEGRPTKQAYDIVADLSVRADTHLKKLKEIVDKDVAAFNTKVKQIESDPVVVRE